MGSRWCCVLTEAMMVLLMLLFVAGHEVSSVEVCPATKSPLSLVDSQLFLVPITEDKVTFGVVSHPCGVNEHFEIDFTEEKLIHKPLVDDKGKRWFQMRCTLQRGKTYIRIEAVEPIYYLGKEHIIKYCRHPYHFNVTFDFRYKFAKLCNDESDVAAPLNIWKDYASNENNDRDSKDKTSEHYLRKWLDLEKDNRDYHSSFRGGHIIFIPVGAIIFLLSVCLRCCLCRRRKVVQRVRTITVVRRVPVPTSSDFTHVNEPTSSDPMDLPPSYADIEDELPPPAYSELQNVNEVSGNVIAVPSSEETQTATDAAPSSEDTSIALDHVDGDLSERETRSTLSRVLTSGSRSLKSQFSFKPMKEEEE